MTTLWDMVDFQFENHRSGTYRDSLLKSQIICHISTDEDPSLRIEISAKVTLRGVSTKLN